MPDGATRLVSLHDSDARPICKGCIDKPVEFGYKAQVIDNDDGIVVDYSVECGAVPDGPQLVPFITRVARRTGLCPPRSPPTAATARPPSNETCMPPECAALPFPARPPPRPQPGQDRDPRQLTQPAEHPPRPQSRPIPRTATFSGRSN
jgi:hypothetical protein